MKDSFIKMLIEFFLGLIIILVCSLIFGWAIMALWNWLMPTIFGLPIITFWQAFGLNMLSSLLIKTTNTKTNTNV